MWLPRVISKEKLKIRRYLIFFNPQVLDIWIHFFWLSFFCFPMPHLSGPISSCVYKMVDRISFWIKNIFHNKVNEGLFLEHENHAVEFPPLARRLCRTGWMFGGSLNPQIYYAVTCTVYLQTWSAWVITFPNVFWNNCSFLAEKWFLLKESHWISTILEFLTEEYFRAHGNNF